MAESYANSLKLWEEIHLAQLMLRFPYVKLAECVFLHLEPVSHFSVWKGSYLFLFLSAPISFSYLSQCHTQLPCSILGCVDTEEADIYLLIDGSGSPQATDFQEMKTFLSQIVRMFNIAPQNVRVGAVQYADSWDLEFEISKYTNKHDLVKAIENIRQMGGSRNTGAALNFTLGLLQKAKKQRGNRVPCHLIVLTNGMSKDSILEPATRLREELIRVYAIGVKEADQSQLQEIAGEEKRVYYVHDFDALKDIRNQVVQEICTEEGRKMAALPLFFSS